MHCPYCRNADSKVLDSRTTEDGTSIRRRRQCPSCERRFTTIEQMQLVVVKRSGVVEPFNRDKVINGVRNFTPHRLTPARQRTTDRPEPP
jgi:transcriptional repressor NrdR